MNASIISIGDELLNGSTLNTNSQWLSEKMTELGISVNLHCTIEDKKSSIIQTLQNLVPSFDLILITGGLGPTMDDKTVDAVAEFLQEPLVLHENAWQHIQSYYISRNKAIHEPSKKMAYLPKNAQIIPNSQGTAPGFIYVKNKTLIVSLPGVPYEMKKMIELNVIPFIQTHYALSLILQKYFYTAGVGETVLSDALEDIEKNLSENFSLAYLPGVGKVKLRLTGKGIDRTELEKSLASISEQIERAIQKYIYSTREPSFEKVIGQILKDRKLSLGTAESCTGGYISHLITSVAGSSDYFKGAIISYSNAIKNSILDVQLSTLQKNGAVSEETVSEMLTGALNKLQVDIAIAVSGVAGPGGGTEAKPVGCVYIGVADANHQMIRRLQFTNNRIRNIELSAVISLVMLKIFIQKYYPNPH